MALIILLPSAHLYNPKFIQSAICINLLSVLIVEYIIRRQPYLRWEERRWVLKASNVHCWCYYERRKQNMIKNALTTAIGQNEFNNLANKKNRVVVEERCHLLFEKKC